MAISVVEIENRDSWIWFMEKLKLVIGAGSEEMPLIIMSDKPKVILFTLFSFCITDFIKLILHDELSSDLYRWTWFSGSS